MKRRIGAAFSLLFASCIAFAARAQSDAPPDETHFVYHLRQTMLNGSGEYDGWADSLVSVGTYETHGVHVDASYRWRYASPDRDDHGTVDRRVTFDASTRDYTTQTDLDDYDHEPGPLATWLWIPPSVQPDSHVRILEDDFVVVGIEDVDVAGATRRAIHVHGDPDGTRDDDYGTYETHSVDDYFFDAATGMFLREERLETDVGRYHGNHAHFQMQLTVEIVDASYCAAVGPLPDEPVPDVFETDASDDRERDDRMPLAAFAVILVPFGLIAFAMYRAARNPFRTPGFVLERLGGADAAPTDLASLSPHLGAFLPHIAQVAQRSGNAVTIARTAGSKRLAGLSIDDADARLVAVYASDGDCAEMLRTHASRSELISETRYPPLPSVRAALAQSNRTPAGPYAYNLYETFEIMERRGPIDPPEYDPNIVVRMKPEDVDAAAAIAQKVYVIPCRGFLEASLACGDVAFVAKEDEKVVGMALATVVGNEARLHTLIVDPDAQARGLGKELYRARLRALSDLGVERVVTEVAANNHAAIEIARAFGMQKIGEMHVQSARPTRDAISVVRR